MVEVYSEIGKLKKVMVNRPGNEIMQIFPLNLSEMLFEDTPYLAGAQKEHDGFTQILKDQKIEVLYFRDLFQTSIEDKKVRSNFIVDFVDETPFTSESLKHRVQEYYESLSVKELVDSVFCGIRKDNEFFMERKNLADYFSQESPFLVNPMPNSYFMRDSSINIADGVILSNMAKSFRKREPLLLEYVHKYACEFREKPTENLYNRRLPYSIEGGDVAIFSDKVVFIGCTERTEIGAIEFVANSLLKKGFEFIYVFDFQKTRSQMHLDGMLTMINYDTFLVHPLLNGNVRVYKISGLPGNLRVESMLEEWDVILKKALKLDYAKLIPCGGGDMIQGFWELWNLGANVLTLRPGVVVGYDRNQITLELLDKAGIEVHTFSGSELSRGRGGARCMSMPLVRDKL